jgi:hypothetical protein
LRLHDLLPKECDLPKQGDGLKDRLARHRQIKISVVGKKSGKTISIPVWFVLEGEKLYLLPVQGSETRWYQHVLQNPSIRIDARAHRQSSKLLSSLMPRR